MKHKHIKCSITLALVFVLLMSVMAIPVSAASADDFPHFPLANSDYSNVYLPQTVAVQRFLMCYDDDFKARLETHNGTDGFFGSETTAVTKEYQGRKGLSKDGRVGPATWTSIGIDLHENGEDSIGMTYRVRGYLVLYIRSLNGRSGYSAVTDSGASTNIFYYLT